VCGELVCEVLTDFPDRFDRTERLLLGTPPVSRRLERHRFHRGRLILKVQGIDDRSSAEELRGSDIDVPLEDAVPLPEGEYYWQQIIGLTVEDAAGRVLGKVVDILRTGANDVYVVSDSRREILVPAIKDVIRLIDLEASCMVVELPPGLSPE
jgi:16S rRNA processing protein RimM